MSVTFEPALTITLGCLAFWEVTGSFCPSPYNEASFRVWVWLEQGQPPPHTHTPGLQAPSSPRVKVDP